VVNRSTSGGTIKAVLAVDTGARAIRSALITGDFFVYPQRAVFDLEALLKDAPLEASKLSGPINDFFNNSEVEMPGVTPDDFIKIIARAEEKLELLDAGVPAERVNDVYVVCDTFGETVRKNPGYLLLPYCAKPVSCEYRYTKECIECGECAIGDAYRLARERGIDVTTITSFEDLIETLRQIKANGGDSYIGCCCESFYVKHMDDFEEADLPGILLNIDNETCFDLGKLSEAYRGTFESETEINLPLLEKILDVEL
jgi:lipoate-protein ligase A